MLEKHIWDAAEPAVPAPHVAEPKYQSARPEGLLGLIYLRFAELRVIAQRAKLKAESNVPGQNNHH